MKPIAAVAVTLMFLAGCGTIEHTSRHRQPLDRPLTAGVGDVVLRVDRYRELENLFGKADIFGRKTNEGYSELRFAGVEQTGEVVLYRKDVQIITNETTMSRTPFSRTTGNAVTSLSGTATTYGTTGMFNAGGTTNYSSTTIAPLRDFHVVVPPETIPIRLGEGERKLPMDGYIIEILKSTPLSLEFRISKSDQ